MKIPVFVSCPTSLNKTQEAMRNTICRILETLNLEPRALGRSDYPTDLPLREVLVIARHCSGGVILGFNQLTVTAGVSKQGTAAERPLRDPFSFPSPWNHLEAGILFSLGRPLLVFKEPGIAGGIFDEGVTDVFIHKMPKPVVSGKPIPANLNEVFLKWRDKVGKVYYS